MLFSTIWLIAAYIDRPSSSWTVRRGWKRQSPRFATAYRFRGVRSISTATYSPTCPTACTTRSPPITDMIYAATPEEIASRRNAFIRKWRLRHRAVADILEEADDHLVTFTRLPPTQWRSARTTNAIERLHEEFKRRIKPGPCYRPADTAAILFSALLASGATLGVAWPQWRLHLSQDLPSAPVGRC